MGRGGRADPQPPPPPGVEVPPGCLQQKKSMLEAAEAKVYGKPEPPKVPLPLICCFHRSSEH